MVKPRLRRPSVSLTVSTPRRDPEPPGPQVATAVPWFVAAVLGAIGAVAAGWAAVGVGASAAWLTVTRTPLASVLDVIGQGWLASQGARVTLGDVHVGLVPLGLTTLSTAAVAAAAHWAGLQLVSDAPRWRDLGALVGACGGTYAVSALILASLVGTPSQATAAFGGAALIGVVGAGIGGLRALALDPFVRLPDWTHRLPAATGAGLATLAGGSALALVVGFAQRWGQAQSLHAGLAPDVIGSVVLVLVYLAYLPTMLLWAGSYVLGAGITVGTDTLVLPGSSTLGLLPAFPPFAAVPPHGTPLDWLWLSVGVVAGIVVGIVFCRRDAAAGGRATLSGSWRPAVAGLGAAAVWLGASWLSVGSLGSGRLVGMGPVFPALVWCTAAPMVLGSAAAGIAMAVRGRRAPETPGVAEETESMPTAVGVAASDG